MGHLDNEVKPAPKINGPNDSFNLKNHNNNIINTQSKLFENILPKSSGQLTVVLLVSFALIGFLIIFIYVGIRQGLIKSCLASLKRSRNSENTNNRNNNNAQNNKISVRSRKKSQIISVAENVVPEFVESGVIIEQQQQQQKTSSDNVKIVIIEDSGQHQINQRQISSEIDENSILGDATICDDNCKELPPDPDLLNRNSLFALKADYYAHQTRYHKDVSQIPRHLIKTTLKNREYISDAQHQGILGVHEVQNQNSTVLPQNFKKKNNISSKSKNSSSGATDESQTDTDNTIHQPESQTLNKPLFKFRSIGSNESSVATRQSVKKKGSVSNNNSKKSSINTPLKTAVLTLFNKNNSHPKISKSNSKEKSDSDPNSQQNNVNLAQKFEVSNPYNIPHLDRINRVNSFNNEVHNNHTRLSSGYKGKFLPGYKPNDVIGVSNKANRNGNNNFTKRTKTGSSNLGVPRFVPGNTSCTLLSY